MDGIPVAVACRVLGFSTQAFFKRRKNPVPQRDWDDAHLTNAAVDARRDDPAFGYRFIADELRDGGLLASERRIWRLCSQQRLQSTFSKKRGLNRKAGPPVHDDRAQRAFTAPDIDKLWLTDITEHQTGEGKLYLCAVKDVYSKRIDGPSGRLRGQRHDGVVLVAAAEEGPRPEAIGHSRGAAAGDRDLDRTALPPPSTPASPRPADTDRVRGNTQNQSRPSGLNKRFNRTCSSPVLYLDNEGGGECVRAVAGAVVGRDAFDDDASGGEPGIREGPEPGSGVFLLVSEDLAVGESAVVVDRGVDEVVTLNLPVSSSTGPLSNGLTGFAELTSDDAMPAPRDFAKLFDVDVDVDVNVDVDVDVDVDELARVLTFISADYSPGSAVEPGQFRESISG